MFGINLLLLYKFLLNAQKSADKSIREDELYFKIKTNSKTPCKQFSLKCDVQY